MQVATLFRESATLLGAASMMESSSSASTSSSSTTSSLSSIVSTVTTSTGITLPSTTDYKISTTSIIPSPVSVITATAPTTFTEVTNSVQPPTPPPLAENTTLDKVFHASLSESPIKVEGLPIPSLSPVSSDQQQNEHVNIPSPAPPSPPLLPPPLIHKNSEIQQPQESEEIVTEDVPMNDLQTLPPVSEREQQSSSPLGKSPSPPSPRPLSLSPATSLPLALQQDESQSPIPQSPIPQSPIPQSPIPQSPDFQLKTPQQNTPSASSEQSMDESIPMHDNECNEQQQQQHSDDQEQRQNQQQHQHHQHQELQEHILCSNDQISLDAINSCITNDNNTQSTMQTIDETTQPRTNVHIPMNLMGHPHHEQDNNNHHHHEHSDHHNHHHHQFHIQHHMQQQQHEQDIQQHMQQQQHHLEQKQHLQQQQQFHHHHHQFHQQMQHMHHQQQHHQQHHHHHQQHQPQQHPITCIDDLMIDDHHDVDASNRYKLLSPTVKHENQDDGYETSAGDVMTPNSHTSSSHPMTPHQMHARVILPKCEVPQPPSSAVDDPYNFIDDELNSIHMMSPASGGPISMRHQGYPHHPTGPPGLNSTILGGQLLPINGQLMGPGTGLSTGGLITDMTPPKKRGRKKKIRDENGTIVNGILKPVVHKERKKHDRFNGMPEEEVSKRTLPDHLSNNLDIIIIGINPGLFAAYKGHHYAGPGNHFWKCLYLSGLTHEQMTAEEDYKLLDFGIGFTNMVERATKGSADLTRKEIKEGCRVLLDKLRKFRPKIAVFNGKLIFEVFSGKKDFNFGRQPECIEGTNTYMWVMPSSSARCAQLPRAADKVPFYAALKKFRDYLNGLIPHIDDSECVFSDPKYKVCCETEPKTENIIYTEISDLNLTNTNNMLINNNSINNKTCSGIDNSDLMTPGKKKRGRPKKVKGTDGCDDSKTSPVSRRLTPPNSCNNNSINSNLNSINNCNISNSGEMPKKKRGRPKKIKTSDLMNGSNLSGISGTLLSSNSNSNGMTNGLEGINNSDINHNSPNGGIGSLCGNLNQGRLFSPPMHSPSTVGSYCPIGMNASTPPINNNSSSNSNGYHHQHHHQITNPHHHHSHHHQSYQHTSQQQQYTPHSDLSSEISAAISSEHLGESPTPTSPSLGPPDFDPPNSMQTDDTNPHDLRYSSPASTISEQQQSSSHITSHMSGYSTYHNPGSNNSYMSAGGGSSNDGNQNEGYLPQSNQQQQQQPPNTNNGQQNLQMSDVASKSLSGLESLVDQIPTMSENDGTTSAGQTPDSRLCDQSDQFTASCLYSGYPNNMQLNSASSPSSATSNSSMLSPHYTNPNYSNNSNCTTSNTITYGSLSSNFSVSSLTSSNYPTSSYRTNLNLTTSPHHLSGSSGGSPMYMEPHMPVPVNPLYHPYSQHTGYSGYSPVAPPPTIHMPSPNYPYGYGNAGSYPQPGHHPSHPAAGYLTNHPSMFDRIKPDIGYGGF